MSTARESLKHKLKIIAGLPPASPTDAELDLILGDLRAISRERVPTEGDWKAAAFRRVRGAGRHKYAGEDMSNLNLLLLQILNQGGSGQASVTK